MFNIGDRVIAVRPVDGNDRVVDKTGKIVWIRTNEDEYFDVCVEFDEAFIGGHDGEIGGYSAKGKDGHCYYGNFKSFELIEPENITMDFSFDSMFEGDRL